MQKFQQTLIKTILILTGILNLISMNGQPMEAHKWEKQNNHRSGYRKIFC
jgi:hypothetical protein